MDTSVLAMLPHSQDSTDHRYDTIRTTSTVQDFPTGHNFPSWNETGPFTQSEGVRPAPARRPDTGFRKIARPSRDPVNPLNTGTARPLNSKAASVTLPAKRQPDTLPLGAEVRIETDLWFDIPKEAKVTAIRLYGDPPLGSRAATDGAEVPLP
jgi:hypothetical protein